MKQSNKRPVMGSPGVADARMSKGRTKEIAALPSGRVGVHRSGRRWEAYVVEKDLVLRASMAPSTRPLLLE